MRSSEQSTRRVSPEGILRVTSHLAPNTDMLGIFPCTFVSVPKAEALADRGQRVPIDGPRQSHRPAGTVYLVRTTHDRSWQIMTVQYWSSGRTW